MFYGISRSTDQRSPNTKITKFSSKTALLRFLSIGSGNFTHGNPEQAQNWHHTFRYGYELHGRVNKADRIFKDFGTSCYPNSSNDQIYFYLSRYGTEIALEKNYE